MYSEDDVENLPPDHPFWDMIRKLNLGEKENDELIFNPEVVDDYGDIRKIAARNNFWGEFHQISEKSSGMNKGKGYVCLTCKKESLELPFKSPCKIKEYNTDHGWGSPEIRSRISKEFDVI